MGSGKSTIGRLLADQLHFSLVDTDDLIERRTGKTVDRIFKDEGEPAFREQERLVVRELDAFRNTVIATGGGLVIESKNLDSLKNHSLVVCLWASPETIWERVRNQSHRPLLQGPDPFARIKELLVQRDPFYREADVLVNTEFRSAREVVQQVVHQFQSARRNSK